MHVERDELEKTAEYYNSRLPIELRKLYEILGNLPWNMSNPTDPDAYSITYSQFLHLKQQFEIVEKTIDRRDTCGTHSRTGQARFRHIAYPDQFPAAAWSATDHAAVEKALV